MATKAYIGKNVTVPIIIERDAKGNVKSTDADRPASIYHIIPCTGTRQAEYQAKKEFVAARVKQAALEDTVNTAVKVSREQQEEMTEFFMEFIPRVEFAWLGDQWMDEIKGVGQRREFFAHLMTWQRTQLMGAFFSDAELRGLTFRPDPVDGAADGTRPDGERKKRPKRRA